MIDVKKHIASLGTRLFPAGIAFVTSFCIMTIELVASRIIARHLGSSLYTWTAVIGIVLGGITVGNFIGGLLADRYPPRRLLPPLFFLAAANAMCIPYVNNVVATWMWHSDGGSWLLFLTPWDSFGDLSWPARIFMHTTLVFSVPSLMLGLIGPVVATMAIKTGDRPGTSIGFVYAAGAFGSIMGTFATGFFLISTFGSTAIIRTVGALLALIGIGIGFSSRKIVTTLCIAGLIGIGIMSAPEPPILAKEGESGIMYQKESDYFHMTVNEVKGEKQWYRSLVMDNLTHAYLDMYDASSLHYDYENVYKALTFRLFPERQPFSALFLGGGGYVYPWFIHTFFPGSHLQVAEIDPAVTEAVFKTFALNRDITRIVDRADEIDPNEAFLWIRHADARNHVKDLLREKAAGTDVSFDVIYGDAFGNYSVPFHLTTVEFARDMSEIMSPSGVYMMNVIDIFDSGQFLGSTVTTLKQVFPYVYVYCNSADGPDRTPNMRDTFVVVASKQPLDLKGLPGEGWQNYFYGSLLNAADIAELEAKSHGRILTDDFAPVEQLMAPVVARKL